MAQRFQQKPSHLDQLHQLLWYCPAWSDGICASNTAEKAWVRSRLRAASASERQLSLSSRFAFALRLAAAAPVPFGGLAIAVFFRLRVDVRHVVVDL